MVELIPMLAQEVFENLGPGLSEVIYQKALSLNLRLNGYVAENEVIINISFNNENVGFIRADVIVDKEVCLELKAKASLSASDRAQAAAYLKHNDQLKHAILINFPSFKPQIEFELITRDSLHLGCAST